MRRRVQRRRSRRKNPAEGAGGFLLGAAIGAGVGFMVIKLMPSTVNVMLYRGVALAAPAAAGYLVGGGAGLLGALTVEAVMTVVILGVLSSIH